jgi:hypothetical protein
VIRGTYRRTADFRVSTTDSDATPTPLGDGRTHLGYQDHYVVDGGRARVILSALVTPAEVQENQPALDLLWWARFRWKLQPHQVTGDTKYGTTPNIVAIEQQQLRAYFPYRDDLERSRARMAELVDHGYDALGRYDVEVAAGGDAEKALWTALYLTGNHVRYFTELAQGCDRLPRQAALFDSGGHPEVRAAVEAGVGRVAEVVRGVAPDAH